MGFFADLEIENKNEIPIQDESGINVGNSLASFLSVFEYYLINGNNSPEFSWFTLLESKTKTSIRILPEIMYAYNGVLTDEQISEYTSNWQANDPITKEEVIKRLNIEIKWMNIDTVLKSVEEIIRILPTMGEDTFWYVKENTFPAFKSLLRVLQIAQSEGGKRVRLHFE